VEINDTENSLQHPAQALLDAQVIIRTAEIATDGTVRIQSGATVVQDSTGESEATETKAKAQGAINALSTHTVYTSFLDTLDKEEKTKIQEKLGDRDNQIADFRRGKIEQSDELL
jgi:hypothetical protein